MKPFKEIQRPPKLLQIAIGILVVGSIVLAFGNLFVSGQNTGENTFGFVLSLIVGVPALYILFTIRLETEIDAHGITYRFFPIQRSLKFITWDDIDSAEVRRYRPLLEYGGWGLRHSFRNGKAYNIKGKDGLQLVMKDGKKILLGTQRPDDITSFLSKIKDKRVR
jgi:hypothetical protein